MNIRKNISRLTNRRARYSPPLSPAVPGCKYVPATRAYMYHTIFDGMYGDRITLKGIEQAVNNTGNFYKVCLLNIEGMETEVHLAPRKSVIPKTITRKGEGFVNGISDSASRSLA